MIVLDTNVISALMRQAPEAVVVEWLDRQPRSSVWTTAVTVMEVRFGLAILAEGKRKKLLVEGFERMLDAMGHRVAGFDGEAATHAAALMAARQRRGRPGGCATP